MVPTSASDMVPPPDSDVVPLPDSVPWPSSEENWFPDSEVVQLPNLHTLIQRWFHSGLEAVSFPDFLGGSIPDVLVVPLLIQRWSILDSKVIHFWFRGDPFLIPRWSILDSEVIHSWFRGDPLLIQRWLHSWFRGGSILDPEVIHSWFRGYPFLIQRWFHSWFRGSSILDSEVVPLDGEEPTVWLLVHVACNGLWDVVLRPDLLDGIILLLTQSQGVAAPVSTKVITAVVCIALHTRCITTICVISLLFGKQHIFTQVCVCVRCWTGSSRLLPDFQNWQEVMCYKYLILQSGTQ